MAALTEGAEGGGEGAYSAHHELPCTLASMRPHAPPSASMHPHTFTCTLHAGCGGVFSPPAATSPTGSPRASFVSADPNPVPFLGSEGGASALADRLADVVRARASSDDDDDVGGTSGDGAAPAAEAAAAAAGAVRRSSPQQAVDISGSPTSAARRMGAKDKEAAARGGEGPASRKEAAVQATRGTHLRSSSLPDLPQQQQSQQQQQAGGPRAGLQLYNFWGASGNSSAGRSPSATAPAARRGGVGGGGADRDGGGGGDSDRLDPLQGYDPDVCTLGLAGRVALPSTAVRDTAATSSATASSLSAWGSALRGRGGRAGEAGGPSPGKSSSGRRDRTAATAAHLAVPPSPPTSTSSSSRFTVSKQLLARGKKWLLDKSKMKPRDRWSDYRIGEAGTLLCLFHFCCSQFFRIGPSCQKEVGAESLYPPPVHRTASLPIRLFSSSSPLGASPRS